MTTATVPATRPLSGGRDGDVFHRVSRIIPDDQVLLVVEPERRAGLALQLMRDKNFSQLPVLNGKRVVGLFSLRSFALKLSTRSQHEKERPEDLMVGEYLEQPTFVSMEDDMRRVAPSIEEHGAVLVGSRDNLGGLVTAFDLVRYQSDQATPFFLIQEIELSLRALILRCVTKDEVATLARITLRSAYEHMPEKLPCVLEDMTFEQYKALIVHGETWTRFEKGFGSTRVRVQGKLNEIAELRNAAFHFRRLLNQEEHETLQGHSEWLATRHECFVPHGEVP